MCSVSRSGGIFGTVLVQWAISPEDGTTFPLTTGSAIMANGEALLNISIQVNMFK